MFDKRSILLCALLGMLTLGLYLPAASFKFIDYDDNTYITRNTTVQRGLTWEGLKWSATSVNTGNWHPLTWVSHMLDCQIYGLKAGGHHFTNILLHSCNAMLLFLLLCSLTGAAWPSWIVAALFAWHPAHVESVAWVSERKDVLSTFFGFLCMLAYVAYAKETQNKRRAMKLYWLAFLSFSLSLLSKSMLVTLPFVLLLLDFWPLHRLRMSPESSKAGEPKFTDLLTEKLPFLVVVFLCCFVTLSTQDSSGAIIEGRFSIPARLEHVLVSYLKYMGMLFWPHKLAVFYPHSGVPPMAELAVAIAVLGLISLGALACLRVAPFFAVGWFWFLGTMVPVIGFLQVGMQDRADRYTYFPSIGFFIVLVWGAAQLYERLISSRTALKMITGLSLLACVLMTRLQLGLWHDSITLFGHARRVTDRNVIAYTVLGDALEQAGKYDQAITNLQTAASFNTNYPTTYLLLGNAFMAERKFDQAVASLLEAERTKPDSPLIKRTLGVALLQLGRPDDAAAQFSDAIALDATDAFSHAQMGTICSDRQDIAGAVKHYETAVALDPGYVLALNNLAWIRATSANPEFRDGTEAVKLAQSACELTHDNEPFLLGTLAASYAEAGQFSNAVAAATRAHDLATARNQNATAEQNEHLLQLYRAGHAFHEGDSNTN